MNLQVYVKNKNYIFIYNIIFVQLFFEMKHMIKFYIILYFSIAKIKCQKMELIGNGDKCSSNADCSSSSFCCSEGKCQNGSFCMIGIKILNDVCDFRYECLSRCCVDGVCGQDIMHCRQYCERNSQCDSACCGEHHCTLDIVCEGNKVNSDYCDINSECVSGLCKKNVCRPKSENKHHCLTHNECLGGYCENNICSVRKDLNILYQKVITTILVLAAILILIMGIIYWL